MISGLHFVSQALYGLSLFATTAVLFPFASFCNGIATKYPFYSLTLNNNIFPWEIKEYAQIGINKFKFVKFRHSKCY